MFQTKQLDFRSDLRSIFSSFDRILRENPSKNRHLSIFKDRLMPPLVDIPDIVQHCTSFFASVFSPQALQQFQRYLSGLILSANKTVEGINRLFILATRHQSSLNRLLTESPFDIEALHHSKLTSCPLKPLQIS